MATTNSTPATSPLPPSPSGPGRPKTRLLSQIQAAQFQVKERESLRSLSSLPPTPDPPLITYLQDFHKRFIDSPDSHRSQRFRNVAVTPETSLSLQNLYKEEFKDFSETEPIPFSHTPKISTESQAEHKASLRTLAAAYAARFPLSANPPDEQNNPDDPHPLSSTPASHFVMLHTTLSRCARDSNVAGASRAYHLLKLMGADLSLKEYSSLLYVFTTRSNVDEYVAEISRVYDMETAPSEKTAALLIKYHCNKAVEEKSAGRGGASSVASAIGVLDSVEATLNTSARLRSYLPIFEAMTAGPPATRDELRAVRGFFERMVSADNVQVFPEECIALLTYALVAYRTMPDVYETRGELVEFVEYMLRQLQNRTLSVTLEQANAIKEAAATTFPAGLTLVNGTSGACCVTGVQLQQLTLTATERNRFFAGVVTKTESAYRALNKHRPGVASQKAKSAGKGIVDFAEWMDRRKGRRFTAIVDAPNVAYFGQNYEGGKFRFAQIATTVARLEQLGEFPLVILPFKYSNHSFSVHRKVGQTWSTANPRDQDEEDFKYEGPSPRSANSDNWSSFRQTMTVREIAFVDAMWKKGQLYIAPPACLDDFLWMLASVSEQTNATDTHPPSEDGQVRPLVLTNDHMRDHQHNMLEVVDAMVYHKWVGAHIANYENSASRAFEVVEETKEEVRLRRVEERKRDEETLRVVTDGTAEELEQLKCGIELVKPDAFSRVVQSNGGVFHLPIRTEAAAEEEQQEQDQELEVCEEEQFLYLDLNNELRS